MEISSPSPFAARWTARAPMGGTALDLACGAGRHIAMLRAQERRVTALDIDVSALKAGAGVQIVEADIEGGPWPLAGRRFDLILVVNYLWRPIMGALAAALAPGGHLVWETFARGNEAYGRPRNPDFLLEEGELLRFARAQALEPLAYFHGPVAAPRPAMRQALAARAATSRARHSVTAAIGS